jgi:hypothetical protein
MKLLSRDPKSLIFRISRREHEAMVVALRLRSHLSRARRSIASDTLREDRLRTAEEDLAEALKEHREELTSGTERLLADAAKCSPQKGGGYHLTLAPADAELLLQALNDVRVGAWEKLGCPDFEGGDRPGLNDENFLCFWAFQVTDLFQGELLAALSGEE